MNHFTFYHQLRYIRSIPEGSSDSEHSDNTEPTTWSQLLPVESDSDSLAVRLSIKKSNVPKNVNKSIKPKWLEENIEVGR